MLFGQGKNYFSERKASFFQRGVPQLGRTRGSPSDQPPLREAAVPLRHHSQRRHRLRHEEQLPGDARLHEKVSRPGSQISEERVRKTTTPPPSRKVATKPFAARQTTAERGGGSILSMCCVQCKASHDANSALVSTCRSVGQYPRIHHGHNTILVTSCFL